MEGTFSLALKVVVVCICLHYSECRPYKEVSHSIRENYLKRFLNTMEKRMNEEKVNEDEPEILCYVNGTIYTVDTLEKLDWDKNPHEAIVIESGEITFLGSTEGALHKIKRMSDEYYYNEGIAVYNLNGHVILPGIHDIHTHPLEAMSPVGRTCNLTANTDPENEIITNELKKCRHEQIGTDWILGGGHTIHNLLEYAKYGSREPKEILDDYIKDKPAVMLEQTSHSIWVNSEALRIAGIDRNTPVRPGGVIMLGKDGEPNGLLFENEVQNMMDLALDIEKYPKLKEYNYEGLLYALEELSAYGITSICDARLYWKRGHQHAWRKACDYGKLNIRAILGLWAYPHSHDDDDAQIKKLQDMHSYGNPYCDLRVSQIKMYSDGLLDSYTAAMLNKYSSKLYGMPGLEHNVGLNYFDKDRMRKFITELQWFRDRHGAERRFDFNIHAIGDRGIRETLDAISASISDTSDDGTRHRITHVEVTHPSDRKRFHDIGVIADFQVAGDFAVPDQETADNFKYLIGDRYDKGFIQVKSIRDEKALTTFSSDWDVSDLNPFIGIEHATKRGDQSLDVKDAIEMYTINPAYAMRQEKKVGSLRVKKKADLIVIDQNILNPKKAISNTRVLQTVFKGKSVFRSADFTKIIRDITDYYTYIFY